MIDKRQTALVSGSGRSETLTARLSVFQWAAATRIAFGLPSAPTKKRRAELSSKPIMGNPWETNILGDLSILLFFNTPPGLTTAGVLTAAPDW